MKENVYSVVYMPEIEEQLENWIVKNVAASLESHTTGLYNIDFIVNNAPKNFRHTEGMQYLKDCKHQYVEL